MIVHSLPRICHIPPPNPKQSLDYNQQLCFYIILNKMKIKKETSYKSYKSDPQDNSQDQQQHIRKVSHKPLNLNKQQLEKRLSTLKDYNTWKNTKPLRINLKEIDSSTKEPIINAAVCYGSNNGNNGVLRQFVELYEKEQSHLFKGTGQVDHFSPSKQNSTVKESSVKASFLKYKKSYSQIHKINKMIIPKSSIDSSHDKSIKRTKALPHNNQPNRFGYHNKPFPKELQQLKNKLRANPHHKTKISELSNPTADLQPTNTIDSNPAKASLDSLQVESKMYRKSMDHDVVSEGKQMRNGRKQYLYELQKILDRSMSYLSEGNRKDGGKKDELRGSNSSIRSEEPGFRTFINPMASNTQSLSHHPKHPYWPIHNNDILQIYTNQMKKIAKAYEQRIEYGLDTHHQQKQILKIIKQDFKRQEKQLNRQVLCEQKQSFSQKFDYKIGLQRQSYKKNIKEYLRCKKEYYLQKQRQQIRANGINRVKKMPGIKGTKYQSNNINPSQEQIFNEI